MNAENGDLRLSADSPAIDEGDNRDIDASTDLAENPRIVNNTVDLGAYEGEAVPPEPILPDPDTKIIYVKADAAGNEDGSSWENAYTSLQDAIAFSQAGDEIWVAQGTYKPTTDLNRDFSFVLKDFVAIYGGFTGNETTREERDWRNHETILSGDIGVEENRNDNSYHVVVASDTNNSTILDGFTITGGQALGGGFRDLGGGILSFGEGNTTFANLTISDNHALTGGGIYLGQSSPTLTNVIVSNNFADNNGGGIYNQSSSPEIINGLFYENQSQTGGAIYNNGSNPTITNSTFNSNQSENGGGAIYNVGSSNPSIVTNSIFWDNPGGIDDNQIVDERAVTTISNSVVQGGYPGLNIIDADPLFVNAENGDLRLSLDSPAIDEGDNRDIDVSTDLAGNSRIAGDAVDLGAYEFFALSISDRAILESESGTKDAVFTVTLSGENVQSVTVDYTTAEDTATPEVDYTPTSGTLTFAPGETEKTITVEVNGDTESEGSETFFVNLRNPRNATLTDDRGRGTIIEPLPIPNIEAGNSGIDITFEENLNLEVLNLYRDRNGDDEPADITVTRNTGENTQTIQGSLAWNEGSKTLSFIPTRGLLEPGNYTLTLAGREDGIVDVEGRSIDGDEDGNLGGDYSFDFTIEDTRDRILSLPNFSRSPGQNVNIPANSENGISININNAEGVQKIAFEINYDPELLTISDVIKSDITEDWEIEKNFDRENGRVRVTLEGNDPLTGSNLNIVNVEATVPDNAEYGAAGVLDLNNVEINDGDIGAIGDDAVHKVGLFGDVSNDRSYSAFDAAAIARVLAGLDTGFDASKLTDPLISADVTGDRRLSILDALYVARVAVGLEQAEIPA